MINDKLSSFLSTVSGIKYLRERGGREGGREGEGEGGRERERGGGREGEGGREREGEGGREGEREGGREGGRERERQIGKVNVHIVMYILFTYSCISTLFKKKVLNILQSGNCTFSVKKQTKINKETTTINFATSLLP